MLKPKPSIEKMDPYITPGEGRMDALRLDFNENLFGPSPKVLEALRNIAREAYGFYPEYGQLVSALSNFLNVPKECILPTNGAMKRSERSLTHMWKRRIKSFCFLRVIPCTSSMRRWQAPRLYG